MRISGEKQRKRTLTSIARVHAQAHHWYKIRACNKPTSFLDRKKGGGQGEKEEGEEEEGEREKGKRKGSTNHDGS